MDIGTVSVKYVRCKGSAGNSIIISQGDYPYKGDFEDLKLILEDVRMKEGTDLEVAVGVSSPDIIKKTFTIPILPKKEQRDALNWTSAKVLSMSLDDMVYEHMMLGRMEEKGVMKDEVLFVGDGETDMMAAEAFGIDGALIDRNDLGEGCRCTYRIKSLRELF